MKLLYKMCAGHALLPRSLHLEMHEDSPGAVLCQGGFADVSKRKYNGLEVAVKTLRVDGNNRSQDITNVSY